MEKVLFSSSSRLHWFCSYRTSENVEVDQPIKTDFFYKTEDNKLHRKSNEDDISLNYYMCSHEKFHLPSTNCPKKSDKKAEKPQKEIKEETI